ncbi:S-adenosylmethionine:tRNA ribosyltransferase-isomerase [Salmonella enterica]
MLTEKYDFRITDQMTIPLRPHWIANDSYREKCKMLVLNRSKGEIHKVDFSKLTDYIKEGDVICFNDSTYIHPGYQLKVVDCLLTNLHQPKTTHMVLTGQFAGVDLLIKAYTSEHIQSCQFDMFGDCMLIIQDEGQG